MNDKRIKKVIVVNQEGTGSFHTVGEKDVTDIKIDTRQISNDVYIDVVKVFCGENLLEEISMNTPYILTYFE